MLKIGKIVLYSVDEVCEELLVSRPTVLGWIDDASIPAKKVGKRWLIKRDDLHTFLLTPDNIPKSKKKKKASK